MRKLFLYYAIDYLKLVVLIKIGLAIILKASGDTVREAPLLVIILLIISLWRAIVYVRDNNRLVGVLDKMNDEKFYIYSIIITGSIFLLSVKISLAEGDLVKSHACFWAGIILFVSLMLSELLFFFKDMFIDAIKGSKLKEKLKIFTIIENQLYTKSENKIMIRYSKIKEILSFNVKLILAPIILVILFLKISVTIVAVLAILELVLVFAIKHERFKTLKLWYYKKNPVVQFVTDVLYISMILIIVIFAFFDLNEYYIIISVIALALSILLYKLIINCCIYVPDIESNDDIHTVSKFLKKQCKADFEEYEKKLLFAIDENGQSEATLLSGVWGSGKTTLIEKLLDDKITIDLLKEGIDVNLYLSVLKSLTKQWSSINFKANLIQLFSNFDLMSVIIVYNLAFLPLIAIFSDLFINEGVLNVENLMYLVIGFAILNYLLIQLLPFIVFSKDVNSNRFRKLYLDLISISSYKKIIVFENLDRMTWGDINGVLEIINVLNETQCTVIVAADKEYLETMSIYNETNETKSAEYSKKYLYRYFKEIVEIPTDSKVKVNKLKQVTKKKYIFVAEYEWSIIEEIINNSKVPIQIRELEYFATIYKSNIIEKQFCYSFYEYVNSKFGFPNDEKYKWEMVLKTYEIAKYPKQTISNLNLSLLFSNEYLYADIGVKEKYKFDPEDKKIMYYEVDKVEKKVYKRIRKAIDEVDKPLFNYASFSMINSSFLSYAFSSDYKELAKQLERDNPQFEWKNMYLILFVDEMIANRIEYRADNNVANE